MILRLELYSSGHRIIPPENQNFYNLSFTLHGLFMIFFLVMPGLYGGFGNYFVPIFLGAPEVGFPRVNSFSFLSLPVSYGFILVSTASEFPGGAGWTLYPPLSTSLMSLSPVAVDLIIDALLVAGVLQLAYGSLAINGRSLRSLPSYLTPEKSSLSGPFLILSFRKSFYFSVTFIHSLFCAQAAPLRLNPEERIHRRVSQKGEPKEKRE